MAGGFTSNVKQFSGYGHCMTATYTYNLHVHVHTDPEEVEVVELETGGWTHWTQIDLDVTSDTHTQWSTPHIRSFPDTSSFLVLLHTLVVVYLWHSLAFPKNITS